MPIIEGQTHIEYLSSPGMSQSTLKEILLSPLHLKHTLSNPKKETDVMRFGSLLHCLTFTPSRLDKEFVFISDDINTRSKDGKAEKQAIENKAKAEKKTLVWNSDKEEALKIVNSLKKDELASKFLNMGKKELSLYATDPDTGLALKGRLDILPDKGNMVADLKSAMDASKQGFRSAIWQRKYYIQAAFYLDLLKLNGIDRESFVFIAVEKEPPYACGVYFLNSATIEEGRREYKSLLKKYKECLETDKWGGYTDKPEEVGIYIPNDNQGVLL